MSKICIVPAVEGIGGVSSFRAKFESGLKSRNIQVTNNLNEKSDAVLVIAGIRDLYGLHRARKHGTRIVQRLDGINWLHRRKFTSLRYWARSIQGNAMISFIRRNLADRIVYQSHFVTNWWEDWYGATRKPYVEIYNGVDTNIYTPQGASQRPQDIFRLLVVEGILQSGHDTGLSNAIQAAQILKEKNINIEIAVAAQMNAAQTDAWIQKSPAPITFLGVIPREKIPQTQRDAHLYYSVDLNAACPNSAIEALACGTPVVGYDTGALKELVPDDAGCIVPYGGDAWKLDPPDIRALANGMEKVLKNLAYYQAGARRQAEKNLGLDMMVEKYLNVLLG